MVDTFRKKPLVLIALTSVAKNPWERWPGVISNPYERLRLVSNFLSIANEVKGLHFILKFHGRMDDPTLVDHARLVSGLKELPENFEIVREGSPIPLLQKCLALFCLYSSIICEATLLRKPVFITNFSELRNIIPFEECTGLPPVESKEQAVTICRNLAEGTLTIDEMLDKQERIVPLLLGSRDGRSAERITEFIMEKLRNEEPATREFIYA